MGRESSWPLVTHSHTEKFSGFFLSFQADFWVFEAMSLLQEGITIFGKWLSHCKCQAINRSKVKDESEEKVFWKMVAVSLSLLLSQEEVFSPAGGSITGWEKQVEIPTLRQLWKFPDSLEKNELGWSLHSRCWVWGQRRLTWGCAANIPVQGPGWCLAWGLARERPGESCGEKAGLRFCCSPESPVPLGPPPQQHIDKEWKSSSWWIIFPSFLPVGWPRPPPQPGSSAWTLIISPDSHSVSGAKERGTESELSRHIRSQHLAPALVPSTVLLLPPLHLARGALAFACWFSPGSGLCVRYTVGLAPIRSFVDISPGLSSSCYVPFSSTWDLNSREDRAYFPGAPTLRSLAFQAWEIHSLFLHRMSDKNRTLGLPWWRSG